MARVRTLRWSAGRTLQLGDETADVDPERRGDLEDLDEVEPPLAALVLRDEGLRPSENERELSLADAPSSTGLDEPLAESSIRRTED